MDKNLEEKFSKYCLEANINISDEQLKKFSIYMDFLIEYNEYVNLTSIVKPEEIIIKHFLDSLMINKFLNINSVHSVIDIGTGAGFPGIPIKICFPDIKLTVLDSLNKRVVFLEKLCDKLNLDVNILHSRAEEMSKNILYREKFDLVLSRAVATLNILSEYCIPYVKRGGFFVSYKGTKVFEEILKSENCIKILGGKISRIEKFRLPITDDTRYFVIIEKINSCNNKYPRTASKIMKNPL